MSVSHAVEPIVINLAKIGISRFYGRWSRLSLVRRQYLADDATRGRLPAVDTAIKDVRTILAQQGDLTEPLANFLERLSQSGLFDQMVMAAVTGVNSLGALSAFLAMYEVEVGANSLDPANLYLKILAMLKASILGNESAGVYLGTEIYRIISDATVLLEGTLKTRFAPAKQGGKPISTAELIRQSPYLLQPTNERSDLLVELAKAVAPQFARIRVEGPSMRSMELEAEKIYVPSTLQPVDFRPTEGDGTFKIAPDACGVSVDEFLTELYRGAVVGDPGGGKSTLARMVCNEALPKFIDNGGPFPIFLTLRKFSTARSKDQNLSLFEYLLRELSEQSNRFAPEELRYPIQYLLLFGRALVILDGLDEILSIAQRREFASAVHQFCATYNLCRYIVTSRKVDYKQVSLTGFSTYELAPFDDAAVRKYVELSARNVFNKQSDVATEIERFMDAVGRNASEFRSNPLLLSLIVWLFNATQRIPDNRAEIYEECSVLLFQRWDSLRELSPDLPDAHRLWSLLGYLASEMYLNSELQGGAPKEWLKTAIKDFFLSDYSDSAESRASATADKFLFHLAGRAWVLRALGSNRYEFTHRTFMEYFFAKFLNDKHMSLDALMAELSPHIARGEWNVPCHLSLQIAVAGKRMHAERAVKTLAVLHEKATPKEKSVAAEFIAQATEYLQPPEPSLERIARIITIETSDDLTWKQSFVSILQTPNEMRGAIFKGLGLGFSDLIHGGRLHRMGFVIDYLKAYNVASALKLERILSPRLRLLGEVRTQITENFLDAMKAIEDSNAAACKARFDLTGEFDENIVRRLGLRLWLSSSERPLLRVDWRKIDFELMMRELLGAEERVSGTASAPHALLAASLSMTDFSRCPVPFSIGKTVVAGPEGPVSRSDLRLPESDAKFARALAFATMGFVESGGTWCWEIPHQVVLRHCINLIPESADNRELDVRQFALNWLHDDKKRLFHSPHQKVGAVTLDNLLR